MRTDLFMYFELRNGSGHRVKVCRQQKCFKPPVVYATTFQRPGVIPVCCVAFWPFHVESCLALCSHVVIIQSCLALWSSRLGKRELVYALLVLLFVYFAYVKFFSLFS